MSNAMMNGMGDN